MACGWSPWTPSFLLSGRSFWRPPKPGFPPQIPRSPWQGGRGPCSSGARDTQPQGGSDLCLPRAAGVPRGCRPGHRPSPVPADAPQGGRQTTPISILLWGTWASTDREPVSPVGLPKAWPVASLRFHGLGRGRAAGGVPGARCRVEVHASPSGLGLTHIKQWGLCSCRSEREAITPLPAPPPSPAFEVGAAPPASHPCNCSLPPGPAAGFIVFFTRLLGEMTVQLRVEGKTYAFIGLRLTWVNLERILRTGFVPGGGNGAPGQLEMTAWWARGRKQPAGLGTEAERCGLASTGRMCYVPCPAFGAQQSQN